MKLQVVTCCVCERQVEDQPYPPPTWYGHYFGDQLISAICAECLPKNREAWRNGTLDKTPDKSS